MGSFLLDPIFFLPLLFLSYFYMGLSDSSKAAESISVIQTPPTLKVMEGSTVEMECSFQGNISDWSIEWFKNGSKTSLINTNRSSIIHHKNNRSSTLILKKTEVADSGNYTCEVKSSGSKNASSSNGTQLTVDGLSDSPKVAESVSVIQTPATLKVMEGSTVEMECSFQENISRWSIGWFKNESNKTSLINTSRRSVLHYKDNRSSTLILKKTEVADSGNYTCEVKKFSSSKYASSSNGTQLTVDAITDLMVKQTPERINQSEGTNVTIACRFRTVNDHNFTDVRWYRNGMELNGTDSLRIEVDREGGFTSLILKNAAANDSGNYICKVKIASRNLTGSGNTTSVHITTALVARKTEPNEPLGTGIANIGAWAGAGVVALLLLVVAGVVIWRWRSKGSRSDRDTPPAKEIGLHPPLAGQPSEVTYADLRFQKREVQPDAEVVYAEVRGPRKQQACKDADRM